MIIALMRKRSTLRNNEIDVFLVFSIAFKSLLGNIIFYSFQIIAWEYSRRPMRVACPAHLSVALYV